VGVAFDGPSLPPNLSVHQALEHARLVCGARSRSSEEVELLLGLEPYRRVKVRRLSRGNLQRASIAHALVGRPELVVLDEPFAGLDADGVDDLVELIRRLRDEEGTTFIVASHQLAYMERTSTHVGILAGGRIALEGELQAILGERPATIWIRASEPSRALKHVRSLLEVRSAELADDGQLRVESRAAEASRLNRELVTSSFEVSALVARPPSLESVFREVVGPTEGRS
jgi:ABC-2 type transport system ATP-binding protein